MTDSHLPENIKTIKTIRRTAVCSLILFCISLTQTALTYDDFDGQKTYPAISLFLFGSISILGGALFEWLTWFANPIYIVALILFFLKKRLAIYFSIPATLIALSFSFWDKLLVAENGRTATIVSLDGGYLLWVTSFMTLTGGTIYYQRRRGSSLHNSISEN